MSVQINIEGERELAAKLSKFSKESLAAAQQGMQRGAMKIINSAKDNLRSNRSISTGQLRASGRVQKVDGKEDTLDVGFFSENSSEGYALFVEEGRRRKGKMPPPSMIEAWLQKKTSTRSGIKNAFRSAAAFERMKPEAYRRQLAYAIARSIAEYGTQARPFFRKAVEEHQQEITQAIEQAVKAKL